MKRGKRKSSGNESEEQRVMDEAGEVARAGKRQI